VIRRRLFTIASAISVLLCLATVGLWVRSEWMETYVWADGSAHGSAVMVCEFGHLIAMTCGSWPTGSSWRAASEDLRPPSAYRAAVIPVGTDDRDFMLPGFFCLSQTGYLILPPSPIPPSPIPPSRGSALSFARVNRVRISLAWPVAITAMLPTIFAVRRVRSIFRPPAGHCLRCGYSLTGNASGICPECGTPVPRSVSRGQVVIELEHGPRKEQD
jgi:hypothetical protein